MVSVLDSGVSGPSSSPGRHSCPIHPHCNDPLKAKFSSFDPYGSLIALAVCRVDFQFLRFVRIVKGPCGPWSRVLFASH